MRGIPDPPALPPRVHCWGGQIRLAPVFSNKSAGESGFLSPCFCSVFLMRLHRALRGCSCGSRGFLEVWLANGW